MSVPALLETSCASAGLGCFAACCVSRHGVYVAQRLLCSPPEWDGTALHPSLLAGSERKAFNNDVRALVESRYGRQPFDLQLETKVYVLEKVRCVFGLNAC